MKMYIAIFLSVLIASLVTIYLIPCAHDAPVLQDVYWGPGEQPKKIDQSIKPFKIKFEKEMIDDLKQRLKNIRKLQPSLENTGWTYGMRDTFVPKIVGHWLNKYDFKAREAAVLNKYPQFITNIQGLNIHYIHVKPKLPANSNVKVLPLYVQHGWPGSVLEFQKLIPLLTTPRSGYDFVFEVIAPSLPGFGYSDAAAKPGLGAVEIAHLMKNLMLRLGFDKFYTQGGDWGAAVTANLASMYPEHVLGMHSNMCVVMRPWTFLKIALHSLLPFTLPEDEQKLMFPLSRVWSSLIEESGYLHQQATKPDTFGVGMADSPAALAAHIIEKFSTTTDKTNKYKDDGGNFLEKFTMDELIDNLMMYWAPNKATSAFRIYAETFNSKMLKYKMDNVPVKPPSACAQFPNELMFQSEKFLRDRFVNLVQTSKMPRGGHFAAMEEPQLLADDVYSAVKKMREFDERIEKERMQKNEM